MGACLCKGHKVSVHLSLCLSLRPKLESTPTVPGTELQPNTEGQPIIKDDHRPANGTLTNSKSRSNYNIGELATSSLLGLVATIKEHITKPTAMAQGRVAHLIEWKGWASGGGAAYSSAMWGGTMGSWAGAGTGLQEDQQLYSDLTDEIKEARFAAGVAQQFALAEATLGAWSFQDIPDGSNSSCAPLQDSDGILLSQYVFSAGDVGAPQHCYSGDSGSVFPLMPAHSQSLGTCWQPDVELQPQDQGTSHLDDSIRHADSSSLSEDEVFYD